VAEAASRATALLNDRARQAAFTLLVALLPLCVYVLRLDNVAGMMVDDAWYMILAKALAEGEGYRLLNAPGGVFILPMYPPGFPFLLSLVFRAGPHFPDNVILLKIVSIAAMLGVSHVSYLYLHRLRQLPAPVAALAAIAIALTPSFVFLATSTVMSECVFTLALLVTIVLAHKAVEPRSRRPLLQIVGVAVVAAVTMFVRSVGIAVVVAIFLYLLKERLWNRAAIFAAVVTMCFLPWLMYSRAYAATAEQKQTHRGAILYSYGEQFWMRWAGSASTGRITITDLRDRVRNNVIDIAARGMGGIFAPALLRGPDESGEELLTIGGTIGWTFVGMGNMPANMAVSCVLAAIVLVGFVRTVRRGTTPAEFLVPISLLITVLWPWLTFRFVVPLTPFLFLYFVNGLPAAADFRIARVALLTIAGLHLYDHAGYIMQARSDRAAIDWIWRFDEARDSIQWMEQHVEKHAVIATTNPALVHLHTNHATITLDTLTEPWSAWRQRGARYIAPLVRRPLPSASRGPYKIVYDAAPESSDRVWVIKIP
jgi:hypothetical protein